jgi:hypothetical protein
VVLTAPPRQLSRSPASLARKDMNMKRVVLLMLVGIFGIITGVAANSLRHEPAQPAETRRVPITKIAIQPDAPLSIGSITRATAKILKIELINVSEKTVRSFNYTNYKQCGSRGQPEGGGVWMTDPKVLKPGQKDVFEVGSDETVSDAAIEKCLQNPTEIRFQLLDVTFLDGTTWEALQGDFPGIKSSSP